jgi:hypothetical protein
MSINKLKVGAKTLATALFFYFTLGGNAIAKPDKGQIINDAIINAPPQQTLYKKSVSGDATEDVQTEQIADSSSDVLQISDVTSDIEVIKVPEYVFDLDEIVRKNVRKIPSLITTEKEFFPEAPNQRDKLLEKAKEIKIENKIITIKNSILGSFNIGSNSVKGPYGSLDLSMVIPIMQDLSSDSFIGIPIQTSYRKEATSDAKIFTSIGALYGFTSPNHLFRTGLFFDLEQTGLKDIDAKPINHSQIGAFLDYKRKWGSIFTEFNKALSPEYTLEEFSVNRENFKRIIRAADSAKLDVAYNWDDRLQIGALSKWISSMNEGTYLDVNTNEELGDRIEYGAYLNWLPKHFSISNCEFNFSINNDSIDNSFGINLRCVYGPYPEEIRDYNKSFSNHDLIIPVKREIQTIEALINMGVINDAPTNLTMDGSTDINQGVTGTYTASADDANGDPLTYSGTLTSPDGSTDTINSNTFTKTFNQYGTWNLEMIATDIYGASTSRGYQINVNALPTATPSIDNPNPTVGQSSTVTCGGVDVDGTIDRCVLVMTGPGSQYPRNITFTDTITLSDLDQPGDYFGDLAVYDDKGAMRIYQNAITITVSEPPAGDDGGGEPIQPPVGGGEGWKKELRDKFSVLDINKDQKYNTIKDFVQDLLKDQKRIVAKNYVPDMHNKV